MRIFIGLFLLLIISTIPTMAQLNYDADWKKVSEFDQKGLPQSALKVVNSIFDNALKNKQDAQMLKALIHQMKYNNRTSDSAIQQNLESIDTRINATSGTVKALLLSMRAEILWQYLQQHRYQLRERTRIAGDAGPDITTWDASRFREEIRHNYQASLSDARLLQQTTLSAFEPVIIPGKGTTALRPTLYDLLAHRALDYYKTGENELENPKNQFELTDPAAFAPAATFAAHRFSTTDSSSLQYHAILLLQDLLRFHQSDRAALLDIDLERVPYIYQVAVMEDKDKLYLDALENMEKSYKGQPEVTGVLLLLATYWQNQAGPGENGQPKDKGALLKAKQYCEAAIALAPDTYAAKQCRWILRDLTDRDLQLKTETVNLPGLPFRTLVTYKNLDKIYLRAVPISEEFRRQLRKAQNDYNNRNAYWKLVTSLKPQVSWEQPLVNPQDYNHHSTEIKIDALPIGDYMILASADKDFKLNNNPIALQFTWVSNISYVERTSNYYVLDRTTGKPLSGVELKVWQDKPGYPDDGTLELVNTYKTDRNGKVAITPGSRNNNNVRLEWTGKQDHLFLDNFQYVYQIEKPKKDMRPMTSLFTDRKLYRPGQTVYFKGIRINKTSSASRYEVAPNHKTTVTLFDGNNQAVDSVVVTTNEYGSYAGKFTLPQGRMNGVFTLEDRDKTGRVAFSMEEYKRPKFAVSFDPVKDAYRVGDKVLVNGKAVAYAGNNIDGAKVKYRVERIARFPYPWMFSRMVIPSYSSREILSGEAVTDAGGRFNVEFPALPDKSVNPASKPVYTYNVYAEVTDLNGETRNGETSVSAGYQALEIGIVLNEMVVPDDLKKLKVTTTNINGVFQPTALDVRLTSLQPSGRLLRPRYWEEPDQFIIPKDTYIRLFPNDIYKDEDKPETWQRSGKLLEQKVTTTSDSSIVQLDVARLSPGYYELEISGKDKFGESVLQKKVFELVSPDQTSLSYPTYSWNYTPDKNFEPGETASILVGSAAKDVHVLQSVTKINDVMSDDFTVITDGIKKINYRLTEEDRGGMVLNYTFVKDNRVYSQSQYIRIPWDNKDLQIKLGTHRDKLLPGQTEKWTVQISGYKSEKVAAEMVASMFDASLDAFDYHTWERPYLYPAAYNGGIWNGGDNFNIRASRKFYDRPEEKYEEDARSYAALNWFDWFIGYVGGGRPQLARSRKLQMMSQGVPAAAMAKEAPEMAYAVNEAQDAAGAPPPPAPKNTVPQELPAGENMSVRKDFRETAFFYPDLRTDKDGNISFEFTAPEALTSWRFMSFAHTKDLSMGYQEATVVTQKKLMVQPNPPRFLREGDKITFSAKVSNLSDNTLTGEARLELIDPATMQPVDGWFQNLFPVQHFTIKQGESKGIQFPVQIPHNYQNALLYRVVAQAGAYSDGEENALPVLTNAMLVTETLPIAMRGDGTENFTMEKLLQSGNSTTLQQHAITVEYTSNPAWYAVQALPYLMEYPYDCSEQVFNRYYANMLASHITKVTPGIAKVLDRWKNADTAALISNLEKNQELKAVLLEETPWVLEAKNESTQKKNIALLFDLQRMQRERDAALQKLADKQLPSGAFPWFTGMWDDRFITQYIVAGIGHLRKLGADNAPAAEAIAEKAIQYLDGRLNDDYRLRAKSDGKKSQLSYIQVHYLYARSFFSDKAVPANIKPAYDFYLAQAKQYWLQQSRYAQGMIALTLHQRGDQVTPKAILRSLKENATQHKELGMYWKDNTGGYSWYQAPIETQSLFIEAFETIAHDSVAVSDMKTWLLKNKQTNNWHTTKATADACYAMLLQGSNWLAAAPEVTIQLGNTTKVSADRGAEAGTGYFKTSFAGKEVKPDMGKISVTVTDSKGQPSWGAVYWQYFEQLDKITAAKTPLVLEKELFIEKPGNSGPELTRITSGNQLKVGDKVKVRIILRTDREMEYIHLKDMRAACFEPLNVLSANKWQDGLSYYESTKDASTNFFFSRLPKGTWVFEYPMYVTHTGSYSNGISSVQCMYAPEFSAHSEGLNVKVVE